MIDCGDKIKVNSLLQSAFCFGVCVRARVCICVRVFSSDMPFLPPELPDPTLLLTFLLR